MNLTPEQPDEIDQDLLAQAAAEEAPAELEAKVLALTDPRMLSLLDEALAPEATPKQLADRILAATTTSSTVDEQPQVQPAVIARIGPRRWGYAAAAAVVLAAGVGLWWAGQGDPATTGNPIAAGNQPESITEWIDNEIAQSETFFDEFEGQFAEDTNNTTGRDSDEIWSDLDEYEQFLSDLDFDAT